MEIQAALLRTFADRLSDLRLLHHAMPTADACKRGLPVKFITSTLIAMVPWLVHKQANV